MRSIGVLALVVIGLSGSALAGSEKKAVEKAVNAQVESLFNYDDGYSGAAEFTSGLPSAGVVDAAGLRGVIKSYVLEWGYLRSATVKNLKVVVADADAWATFTVHVRMVEDEQGDAPATFDMRAVEVLSKGDDGAWTVVAGHWGRPVLDRAAKVGAEKGQLGTLVELTDASQEDMVSDLVELLGNGGISSRVSSRADVAVFGTDAMKQRLGGKKTQKAWKAWWKTVTVQGATCSGTTASGQVGWVSANLAIQKGKVSIPARVFLVVSLEAGKFSVVSAILSVPQVPISNLN